MVMRTSKNPVMSNTTAEIRRNLACGALLLAPGKLRVITIFIFRVTGIAFRFIPMASQISEETDALDAIERAEADARYRFD